MNSGRSFLYNLPPHLKSVASPVLPCEIWMFNWTTIHYIHSIQKCVKSFIFGKYLPGCHDLDDMSMLTHLQCYSMCSKYPPSAHRHNLSRACIRIIALFQTHHIGVCKLTTTKYWNRLILSCIKTERDETYPNRNRAISTTNSTACVWHHLHSNITNDAATAAATTTTTIVTTTTTTTTFGFWLIDLLFHSQSR